jgi:hypothetical protein
MIPMADSEGYRGAMVGTLSFYDPEGERAHTLYLAAAPELRIPTHRDHPFRLIVTADSGGT